MKQMPLYSALVIHLSSRHRCYQVILCVLTYDCLTRETHIYTHTHVYDWRECICEFTLC